MRASEVRVVSTNDCCDLQAMITSDALTEPFHLWYRFPVGAKQFISAERGDFLLAALLLPAMQTDEAIELPVQVSPMLARSINHIQAVFCAWDPTLVKVAIKASIGSPEDKAKKEIGLFFSLGVDSQYLLWRNMINHPLNDDVITYLITIYGANIYLSDGMDNVFEEMLLKASVIAERTGKKLISVTTNVGELLSLLGNRRGYISHETVLASVGLALQGMFEKIYIASGETYTQLAPSNAHPLLTPLWSTEGCAFICDTLEASRLEKIRLIGHFQPAMDTLHICWAQEGKYNCGRCAKCLITILQLHAANVLERCQTLPHAIDVDLLSQVRLLLDCDLRYIGEILDVLGYSDADQRIRATLVEILARWRPYFERVEKAKKHLNRLIPPREKFILVDQDTIRWRLGAARGAVPFLERNGQYWGTPPNDEVAVHEVERLRKDGTKYMVFWWTDYWCLDYYAGLGRHLRSQYRCLLEDDSLMIFDLRDPRSVAAPEPAGAGAAAMM